MLVFLIFNGLFVLACGYALARGGQPERAAVIIFTAARLASISANATIGPTHLYVQLNTAMLTVDAAMLLVLLVLALHANRYWPLWIAALQLVEVLAHIGKLYAPDTLPRAYQFSVEIWSFAMLLLLWIGTWRHHRRVQLNGAEPCWSISLPFMERPLPPAGQQR